MEKIFHLIDTISVNLGKLFSYLVPVMVIFEVVEVIRRYVFNSPTIWTWELVTIMFGAHFIMGGAWLIKEDEHVRTDLIFDLFSKKTQALIDLILFGIFFLIFAIPLSWQTINHAIYSCRIGECTHTQWGPPFYPLKIIIALGFTIMLLQGIVKIIRDLMYVLRN